MAVKIVIDPGHGGKDSGAAGFGLLEKNITLDIALHLRDKLAGYADITLTRTADTFIKLAERSAIANNIGADYFISIHVNSGGGTGFESFVHSGSLDRSVQLQEAIHKEVAAFYKAKGFPDRGMKQANYAVLRETQMPAILLENLFIDHAEDTGKLKDPAFREQIAGAIASGVVKALKIEAAAPKPPVQPGPVTPDPNVEPPTPVPPAHWAEPAFQRLVKAGLVVGSHDLDSGVTWGELSAILVKLLDKQKL